MNKYEEAIDNVARYCSDYRMGIFPPRHELNRELDILNKLVEKTIPKKPTQNVYNAYCPNCEKTLGRQFAIDGMNGSLFSRYCPRCGQRLDWSKE